MAPEVKPECAYRQCGAKRRYGCQIDAEREAESLRARKGWMLVAYECAWCGGWWHLGNPVTTKDPLDRYR